MAASLGMRHIALSVRDLQKSGDFYQKAFGMCPFGDSEYYEAGMLPLVSPGLKDQITLVEHDKEGEMGRGMGPPGEQGGIEHFGFLVRPGTNLEKLRETVVAAGGKFLKREDIARGRVPSLFFSDPDGYIIQLTRFPRWTKLYIAYLSLRSAIARHLKSKVNAKYESGK